MPGFQSTRLVTEGALEPFFFLYTDDSIQGNPETCKQSSAMLNYVVKNTMEPHSKFCLILSCDEEHVEIRFHKIHPGEKMWLDENLEDYPEEAIGYAIV